MTFGGNQYSQLTLADRWNGFRKQYPVLAILIAINSLIWLGVSIVYVILWLAGQSYIFDGLVYFLSLPASFQSFVTQPWSIVSYMFLHVEFFHILFNMLWLFWFGQIFLDYLSGRQLLWVYLLGGIAGGLSFMLAYNFFPVFAPDIQVATIKGASASLMAIMAAIATLMPNYPLNLMFIGKIKLKHMAIFMVILDFILISKSNPGGNISHLGGVAWGVIYTLVYIKPQNKKGILGDFSRQLHQIFTFKRKPKFKVYHNDRPISDDDYNLNKKQRQEKIDKILEKISKSGYSSLTKEEKELLFRSSNQNPKN